MGMFAGKGLNKHTSTRSGKFIQPGKYKVKIKATKGKKSQRKGGAGGEMLIVEYEIVKCYEVKKHDPAIGEKWDDNAWVPFPNPEEIVPVGTSYTWIVKLNWGDVALGNIADYIRVGIQEMRAKGGDIVEDYADVDFDDDDEERVCGEENAFMGLELHLSAMMIRTEEKGNPFTKCTWSAPTIDELELQQAA